MSALVGYYQAMTADREAAGRLADAQARQVNAQTGEVADNAAVARNLQAAQTGAVNATAATTQPLAQSEIELRNAQTRLSGIQGQTAMPLALSEIAKNNAQIGQIGAGTQQTLLGLQALDTYGVGLGQAIDSRLLQSGAQSQAPATVSTTTSSVLSPPKPGDLSYSNIINTAKRGILGYAKGTSKVGKPQKPGPTDTIDAKLSPGEAVLNRGAAEHLGGGIIDHLNKLGMMRMAAQDEVAQHAAAVHGHSISAVMKQAHAKMKGKKSAAKR